MYYLKGVIGLPIVISFLLQVILYFFFFFGNGLIDEVIVIGWTDSDFRISRDLTMTICTYFQSPFNTRLHMKFEEIWLGFQRRSRDGGQTGSDHNSSS